LIGHPVGLKITLQQAAGNALAVAVQAAFAVKYLFCGQGGQVVLCCSDQMVCEILQSTKLPIADSVAAGIEKLA